MSTGQDLNFIVAMKDKHVVGVFLHHYFGVIVSLDNGGSGKVFGRFDLAFMEVNGKLRDSLI
jgi:hypothetical protein